jgi:hypothetical protein
MKTMDSELSQLARKLAEGARARVDEEEKRIDAIIARRNAAKAEQQPHPSK